MPEVKTYDVRVWGGPNGYSNEGRTRIQLKDATFTLGWIYFYDEGTPIPNDSKVVNQQYQREQIRMYLPLSMLESVIDLLRNESPIFFQFTFNHGMLSTGSERIGEGE
jgi:hypothetical protein